MQFKLDSSQILYFDQHIVAVNKPSGVTIGQDHPSMPSLLSAVRDWNHLRVGEGKTGYCMPIHFLDTSVTGVVLFGLSSKATARINELFRSRKIQKTYAALVSPAPLNSQGTLVDWIEKDEKSNRGYVVPKETKTSKRCELTYVVLDKDNTDKQALLAVKPVTGRSHQIRIQLSQMNCPIIGDFKYGSTTRFSEGHIALHAVKLEFEHPVGKRPMTIEAALPEYWKSKNFNHLLFNHKA